MLLLLTLLKSEKEQVIIPMETAVVVGLIVAVFLLFAATMFWAERRTKEFRAPGASGY
jgi:hypothetical protein